MLLSLGAGKDNVLYEISTSSLFLLCVSIFAFLLVYSVILLYLLCKFTEIFLVEHSLCGMLKAPDSKTAVMLSEKEFWVLYRRFVLASPVVRIPPEANLNAGEVADAKMVSPNTTSAPGTTNISPPKRLQR